MQFNVEGMVVNQQDAVALVVFAGALSTAEFSGSIIAILMKKMRLGGRNVGIIADSQFAANDLTGALARRKIKRAPRSLPVLVIADAATKYDPSQLSKRWDFAPENADVVMFFQPGLKKLPFVASGYRSVREIPVAGQSIEALSRIVGTDPEVQGIIVDGLKQAMKRGRDPFANTRDIQIPPHAPRVGIKNGILTTLPISSADRGATPKTLAFQAQALSSEALELAGMPLVENVASFAHANLPRYADLILNQQTVLDAHYLGRRIRAGVLGVGKIEAKEIAELMGLFDGWWREHLNYVRQFPEIRNYLDAVARANMSVDSARSLEGDLLRIEDALSNSPYVDQSLRDAIASARAETHEADNADEWSSSSSRLDSEQAKEPWYRRITLVGAAVMALTATTAGLLAQGMVQRIGFEITPEVAVHFNRILEFIRGLF